VNNLTIKYPLRTPFSYINQAMTHVTNRFALSGRSNIENVEITVVNV